MSGKQNATKFERIFSILGSLLGGAAFPCLVFEQPRWLMLGNGSRLDYELFVALALCGLVIGYNLGKFAGFILESV